MGRSYRRHWQISDKKSSHWSVWYTWRGMRRNFHPELSSHLILNGVEGGVLNGSSVLPISSTFWIERNCGFLDIGLSKKVYLLNLYFVSDFVKKNKNIKHLAYQWCATNNKLYKREMPWFCSACLFLRCKHSHHGWFQATNMMSLNTELGRWALLHATVYSTIYFNIRGYWVYESISLPNSRLWILG